MQGLDYLEQLFAGPDSVGTTLAVEAARELANADLVIQTSVAFTRQLLQHLRP